MNEFVWWINVLNPEDIAALKKKDKPKQNQGDKPNVSN